MELRIQRGPTYEVLEGETPLAKAVNTICGERWVRDDRTCFVHQALLEVLADDYNSRHK